MAFHPRRAWRALWSNDAEAAPSSRDLKAVNVAYVDGVKATMPHARAMEYAIGDGFELIGGMEAALVRHYGLPQDGYLIDAGCGAGRLARPLPDATAHTPEQRHVAGSQAGRRLNYKRGSTVRSSAAPVHAHSTNFGLAGAARAPSELRRRLDCDRQVRRRPKTESSALLAGR